MNNLFAIKINNTYKIMGLITLDFISVELKVLFYVQICKLLKISSLYICG